MCLCPSLRPKSSLGFFFFFSSFLSLFSILLTSLQIVNVVLRSLHPSVPPCLCQKSSSASRFCFFESLHPRAALFFFSFSCRCCKVRRNTGLQSDQKPVTAQHLSSSNSSDGAEQRLGRVGEGGGGRKLLELKERSGRKGGGGARGVAA